ncbi:MAG: hypothetical protein HY278_04935 [candidate division NC10 bacterium]|nr:hypothetical protein [candidate division NC10 bacterium]
MGGAKVVVTVSGGNVGGVFTDNPDIEVYLVDYDNLEAEPNEDCGVPFPMESLDAFRSVVETEIERYPGIAKLAEKLEE